MPGLCAGLCVFSMPRSTVGLLLFTVKLFRFFVAEAVIGVEVEVGGGEKSRCSLGGMCGICSSPSGPCGRTPVSESESEAPPS